MQSGVWLRRIFVSDYFQCGFDYISLKINTRNKYTLLSAGNPTSAAETHSISYPIQAPHFRLWFSSDSLCLMKHCQHPNSPVRSLHNMVIPNTVVALPNSTIWQVITMFIHVPIYLYIWHTRTSSLKLFNSQYVSFSKIIYAACVPFVQ